MKNHLNEWENISFFMFTDHFHGQARALGSMGVCVCWSMYPTPANSAFYPQRDGKCVPAKVR